MATKDSLIYQALLRLSGGVLTDSSSVRYGEAEVYLSSAVNYAYLGTYWVEGKAESEHAVNLMLFTPFEGIAVQYSTVNRRYYSILTVPIVTLAKGRSLQLTTEDGKTLIPLPQGDEVMQEYYSKYDKQIKYQLEGNTKIWYWGMEKYPLLVKVRARYIASVYSLPGTTEILLPADGEKVVLELLYAWLSGQKEAPKNYVETGKDVR